MNEKYSALFTPWKIGNVEIKNRIVQPSMGGTSLFGWLEPCHFDKEAAYHILNRAQNNVGLVLPGMQCVRDTMGGRWLYQNKKMFKDLAEWLPEFHKTGSKLFVQLSAGMGRSMAINEIMVKMLQNKAFGAVGKPFLNVDYITASASATPNRWYPECKSRPLTVEEIHEMVDANTIIGKPITTEDGTTILPVSKVSFGFASGGTDFDGKNAANKDLFGGGSGAGVNIQPVAFLVIKDGCVRTIQLTDGSNSVDRALAMLPELVEKVSALVSKKGEKPADEAPKAE